MSSCSGKQIAILTTNYLVVAKVRERLAMSKQIMHTFHMEKFNLKKLNKVEVKNEEYWVEISNRLAAEVDINRAWETITENIKISVRESRLL
jgi:hypothetical protein